MRALLQTAVFSLVAIVAGLPACAQYAKSFPRVLLKSEHAVCRVSVDDSDGATSHGSGVLIQPPATHQGRDYVLTAYHVLRSRRSLQSVRVSWDGQRVFQATIAAARPGCDAALLRVHDAPPEIPRIETATEEIRPGEAAFAFGFGDVSTNRLRCSGGPVLELNQNMHRDAVWFDFAGRNRQGDSGGPVFVVREGRPQVIGCAWGSSYDQNRGHHTITACRLRVLHRLFGRERAVAHQQGSNQVISSYPQTWMGGS